MANRNNDNDDSNGDEGLCRCPGSYLSAREVEASDMAKLAQDAIEQGGSSLRKLRRRYNGDGSLIYKIQDGDDNHNENILVLTRNVWATFETLFERAQDLDDETSNYERPFMVAIDETKRPHRAVRAFIFPMGDENCCIHTDKDMLQARKESPDHTRLAFGHTHPCFPPKRIISGNPEMISKRKLSKLRAGVMYGAMPSNIMVGYDVWSNTITQDVIAEQGILRGQYSDNPEAQQVIQDEILGLKRYKRHGADYCASIVHQHEACNPKGFGSTSYYEFIITPRLRQIGIFHNSKDGVCTYIPWVVEDAEKNFRRRKA